LRPFGFGAPGIGNKFDNELIRLNLNPADTPFGHLGPTPQSRRAIRRLGDANGAFVAAAIRPRNNFAILIYCVPADVQPSHS
jgi:hypothetical protein